MSVESIAVAMHHSRATGAARMVLVGVANHDSDGGAWPSVRTLSKYAHIDPRNVQRHIKTLEALGEVQRVLNGGGNRDTQDHARPNLYRFTLECPENCDRSRNHRLCRKCGDERWRDRKFICGPCKAVEAVEELLEAREVPVDNPEPDPLAVAPPPGGSATPPLAVAPPPPLAEASPEPYIEPSREIGSAPDVTSPGPGSCPQAPPALPEDSPEDDDATGPGFASYRAMRAAWKHKETGSARAFDHEGRITSPSWLGTQRVDA